MDYNESFQWFLDGILTYRDERDADDSPETWTERRLAELAASDNDEEWKAYLSLSIKLAELLDDRKGWLLDEAGEDFHQLLYHVPSFQGECPMDACRA